MDDAERAQRLFDAWYNAKHADIEQWRQQMTALWGNPFGQGIYQTFGQNALQALGAPFTQPTQFVAFVASPFTPPTPTVFTTDLPVVKRETDEPLIAPDVAAYLAEWFAR